MTVWVDAYRLEYAEAFIARHGLAKQYDAFIENLGCAHPQSAERDGAVNAKDNPPATDDGASSDLTDRQPESPRSSTAAEAAAWRGSWRHPDGTVRHA